MKTTLRRLEKNKMIALRSFKRGRHGWRKYELKEEVYQEILNTNTIEHITDTKTSTMSSVVSSNYINTTTNVPREFSLIDCSPLSNVGFAESHIIQIWREYEKNLTLH